MRLSPQNSGVIVFCVCALLAALFLRFEAWPFWVQCLLLIVATVTFPLLNSLGILKQLGLENAPGSHFNAQHMLAGLALFIAGGVWLVALVKLVPNPSQLGEWLMIIPTLMAWGGSVLFFVKGTIWR